MPTEHVDGFTKFEERIPSVKWDESKEFLEPGYEINKATPLFAKIEDEIIKEEKDKLYALEEKEEEKEDEKMSDLINEKI